MIGKSSGWALAAVVGLLLWCGVAGAGDGESTVLEEYRRANVLPAEEIAAVAPEVREGAPCRPRRLRRSGRLERSEAPGIQEGARNLGAPRGRGRSRFDLSLSACSACSGSEEASGSTSWKRSS